MPAPKKTAAPAKKPTTALTVWEQEMAQAAVAQGSTEQLSGEFKSISTRGGILSVDDNPVPNNEMRVVILASAHENQYYAEAFNPAKPATPACYALGTGDGEGLAPHEQAQDKQSEACKGCWADEWGTADTGKGKACKNVRRLVCITEDALESADALKEAESRMLKLPVMSVKNWTNYVKSTLAEDIKRPSWGVVTTVKVVPDAKSQFRVQFRFEELVNFTDDTYAVMKKRVKDAENFILSPYPVFSEEEEKPAAKGPQRRIPIAKAAPAAKAPPARRGKF